MKHFICTGSCGHLSKQPGTCGDKTCTRRGKSFTECGDQSSISSSEKRDPREKTILITGGAGFIGSNVLTYLFDKYPKYHFKVLDLLTYAGDLRNIPKRIREAKNFSFVYGDVRNSRVVEHLVGLADIIIHFAAETHVARSIFDDANFFETDVIGTQRVATAVLNHMSTVDRFIHISTSEVYGTALGKLMDEEHLLVPHSPYAAAKAGADRLVQSYYITYKIPSVIIRPFNMYGPNQHLEKVIPRFITSRLLGEKLTVHGAGDSRRDFTYVTDLARAIDMVMHAPKEKVLGEVFNVGSMKDVSVNEIADGVIRGMKGDKKQKEHTPFAYYADLIGDRPGQVYRHTADATKIRKVLGWKPTIGFADGLKKTIDWYLNNKDWWEPKLWMRHVPIKAEDGKIELH